jgi:hypothetical protein
MRAMMGLLKDRHGTYYARHKVPAPLIQFSRYSADTGNPVASQIVHDAS